jgi:hypothetical protein
LNVGVPVSWTDEIQARADAGEDVTPEVVVSIEGVGDVCRYFTGVVSLRKSGGGEVVPAVEPPLRRLTPRRGPVGPMLAPRWR